MNNKVVRIEGNVYRIITATLWGKTLISAECVGGPERGQLIPRLNSARSARGLQIRDLISRGLVS